MAFIREAGTPAILTGLDRSERVSVNVFFDFGAAASYQCSAHDARA